MRKLHNDFFGESCSKLFMQREHAKYIRYAITLLMLLYTLTITFLYAKLNIVLQYTLTIT